MYEDSMLDMQFEDKISGEAWQQERERDYYLEREAYEEEIEDEGDYGDDEPHGSHDLSDDGDALASAGMGTDEDYGGDHSEDY